MYFSYNGTRDWLKIEWRDQSCVKLEVVAKTKDNKDSVTFRSSIHAFDLRETRLFERGSLVQIRFFFTVSS